MGMHAARRTHTSSRRVKLLREFAAEVVGTTETWESSRKPGKSWNALDLIEEQYRKTKNPKTLSEVKELRSGDLDEMPRILQRTLKR